MEMSSRLNYTLGLLCRKAFAKNQSRCKLMHMEIVIKDCMSDGKVARHIVEHLKETVGRRRANSGPYLTGVERLWMEIGIQLPLNPSRT